MTKEYNKIEAKDNMKVDRQVEENTEVVERKPLKQVVAVQPKKVKRNLFSRLIGGVLGPEGLPGIGTYVNEEIVKPAIKDLIYNTIHSATSRAVYGNSDGPRRHAGGHSRRDYKPRTNYNGRYDNRDDRDDRRVARPSRFGVDDYVIENRNDASAVLVDLTEHADRYDTVSVADYYDLIGVNSRYTDNNFGWSIDTITRATIVPTRGGYLIKFPPVEDLK